MDIKEVRAYIKKIKDFGIDVEAQHSTEDTLYEEVLKSIANDPSNAQELAKEALKTKKLDFPRYYA